MADLTSRIGGASTGASSSYAGVTQTAEGAAVRSTATPRGAATSGTPGAGRGRVDRVTPASQSSEQLDRSAPRGTYLNILA